MKSIKTRDIVLQGLLDGERTGLSLIDQVRVRVGFTAMGRVYPLLQTLQDEGLVARDDGEEESRDRQRRLFRLTAAGRTAAEASR